MSIAYLDEYARSRWESILHYMVGSDGSPIPKPEVLNLLLRSDLMQRGYHKNEYLITSRGFQFLLEDVNTQLWDLLLQYLSDSEERNHKEDFSLDLVEVLSFLFLLGSMELGRDYSTEDLTETQRKMLGDFKEFGLIYQSENDGDDRFYPTRLATTLTSNAPPLISSDEELNEENGYLILETNYRLYAYTGE